MTFLDRLERRFGFIAIPGLLRYVGILSALVFVVYKVDPSYLNLIDLDRRAVAQGEVWRLFTYQFVPAITSMMPFPDWINAAFYVWFLWWIGNGLESEWGAFRLTLYYLVGVLGTTIAALLFGATFSNLMLTSSLFFAFATVFPDVVIYVAYILPMKIKWVAGMSAAFLLVQFAVAPMGYRAALIAAMSNYLLFFGPEIYRSARHRRGVAERRKRFEGQSRQVQEEPLHKCATCGATEVSNSDLEFRVARDGEEYCIAHLPRPADVRT